VRLALFVLPLSLDTFAVSAALGLAGGVTARRRLQLSLLLSGFELTMPVVGLLAGRALGGVLDHASTYVAAAVLVALGIWMIVGAAEAEVRDVHGLALVALGLSISLDELAIGFSFGLLRSALLWALVLIAAQAFVAAQLGLRLGARAREAVRERAELLAGLALIALAVLLLV